MKSLKYKHHYLKTLLVLAIFVLAAACSEDGGEDLSPQLVGTWSIDDVNMNVEVEGIPIDEYLKNGGLTETQINELEDYYQSLIDNQTDEGDIEFKADYTYSADFGSGPETGSWSYDTKTGDLILMPADNVADSSSDWRVLSLTDALLVVSQTQVESDDVNDDGTDEKISIETEMRLVKS
jgi:hypothetical protein